MKTVTVISTGRQILSSKDREGFAHAQNVQKGLY